MNPPLTVIKMVHITIVLFYVNLLCSCKYGPNTTRLDSIRLDTFDFVEPCFSNMADDEEAVVLACTSLVFCALSVYVNKTEKRRHTVWVKDYLKKERLLDATILF